MIAMSLERAATVLQSRDVPSAGSFKGITTDSRKVRPGMMFAAKRSGAPFGFDGITTLNRGELTPPFNQL